MKKRILSLLMAAAMVTGIAMPANATTNTSISGGINDTLEHDVTVTGTVVKGDGSAPAGRLTVEVPTALQFSVDQDGNFSGTNFTIKNRSSEAIEVTVGSFNETNVNSGIVLNTYASDDTGLADVNRANIQLALYGNQKNEVDLSAVNKDTVLSEIAPQDSDSIQLLGRAGKKKDGDTATQNIEQNGANAEFNLVFKIKKKAGTP